ncbi:MAG: DUF493 domain-containing protein [Gammaproteobacteria bacterium]|nr:DUF493 domain-containing protein [Gammaproteobacteria bacterium]
MSATGLQFPTDYPLKVLGRPDETFRQRAHRIVLRHAPDTNAARSASVSAPTATTSPSPTVSPRRAAGRSRRWWRSCGRARGCCCCCKVAPAS